MTIGWCYSKGHVSEGGGINDFVRKLLQCCMCIWLLQLSRALSSAWLHFEIRTMLNIVSEGTIATAAAATGSGIIE